MPAGGVKVKGANGSDVTLTGPIAAKYSAATQAQRTALGWCSPATTTRERGRAA